MQGGGELPWEVTCRGVVDGIAMVIHMTRREGRRLSRKPHTSRLRREGEPMGHSKTRTNRAHKLKSKRSARIGVLILIGGMLRSSRKRNLNPGW